MSDDNKTPIEHPGRLVLGRLSGQRVALDIPGFPRCWVGVVDLNRGKLRLFFDFPPGIGIWREEIAPERTGAGEQ